MIKKFIYGALVALTVPALAAYAATPTLNISDSGNANSAISVSGGDLNSPVTLYYFNPNTGIYQGYSLGTTDVQGSFNGTINTNSFMNSNHVNWSYPVYVSVGGYQSSRVMWPGNSTANGGVNFSQSSGNIGVGGSGSVTLSGGNGSYYILNNSNQGGVSASISGNTLNFTGGSAGSANITVCSTSGGCGTFTTNVGASSPSVSNSSLSVNQGSQGSLTLSGGVGPYTVSVLNGTGVSASLVGNTLYVNGNATGTNTLNICSANNNGCTPVTVNVNASTNTNTGGNTGSTGGAGTGSGISLSLPISVGQNLSLGLSGNGSGNYYLQSPMSSPALASINGNTLVLNGQMAGSGTVTICQTGSTACLPIMLSVSPASQPPLTGTGGGYFFDFNLSTGSTGQDVTELQTRLHDEGYYDGPVTGYYGSLTAGAVMRYQAAHGIMTTGYLGPQTRAALNQ